MNGLHISKPPIWKTLGVAFGVCVVGLFVCVYLLFSGLQSQTEQLKDTQQELKTAQQELQLTKAERNKLLKKIEVLERIEYSRGTLLLPQPIPHNQQNNGGVHE